MNYNPYRTPAAEAIKLSPSQDVVNVDASASGMMRQNPYRTPVAEAIKLSPSQDVVSEDSEVTCAICLGPIEARGNWAKPSDCMHQFCCGCLRNWFKHNTTGMCPTCKIKSRMVDTHINGQTRCVSTDELLEEMAAEKAVEDGNKAPLDLERQIITQRIHYLRTKLHTVRNVPRNPYRICTCRFRHVRSQKCACNFPSQASDDHIIQEVTALDMLRDGIDSGSIKRSDLLSHRSFRKIVYHPGIYLEKYDVPGSNNPRKVNFTPMKCRQSVNSYRRRLMPFLTRELESVQYNRERFRTASKEKWAEFIFEQTQFFQVHSPQFANELLRVVGITSYERLQYELFDFASSNLDMDSYFAIIGYRFKDAHYRRNIHVGGLQTRRRIPDVVTIEDEPVVNLVDSDDEPSIQEVNYIGDGESGSDGEDSEHRSMFMRPGCRLMNQTNAPDARQIPASSNDLRQASNISWLQNAPGPSQQSRSPSSSYTGNDECEEIAVGNHDGNSSTEALLSQVPLTSRSTPSNGYESNPSSPMGALKRPHREHLHGDAKRNNRMDRCSEYVGKIKRLACGHKKKYPVEQLESLRDELKDLCNVLKEEIDRK